MKIYDVNRYIFFIINTAIFYKKRIVNFDVMVTLITVFFFFDC